MSWPICVLCKKAKDPDEFRKIARGMGKRYPYCKLCRVTNHLETWSHKREGWKTLKRRKREKARKALLTKFHNAYLGCKGGARSRRLNFEITEAEYASLIQLPCTYCGELANPHHGLDRVDNSRGYSLDNVTPCCKMCNRMKSNYSLENWLLKIKQIAEFQKEETLKILEKPLAA